MAVREVRLVRWVRLVIMGNGSKRGKAGVMGNGSKTGKGSKMGKAGSHG